MSIARFLRCLIIKREIDKALKARKQARQYRQEPAKHAAQTKLEQGRALQAASRHQ